MLIWFAVCILTAFGDLLSEIMFATGLMKMIAVGICSTPDGVIGHFR